MAPDHQQGRRAKSSAEPRFPTRTVPFLASLWRQPDPAAQACAAQEPELFAALESEIIPRLLIANSVQVAYPHLVQALPEGTPPAITQKERAAFMDALLSEDAAHTRRLAETHLLNGHEPAMVLIDLFAWSARELGALWDDDQVSFVDVTIGLCRLHEALHRYTEQSGVPAAPVAAQAPSILIAVAPGEQHIFGVLMAAELFRQQGWDVTADTSGDPARLIRLVASRPFDIAGLSAAQEASVEGLADLVSAIRNASKNPSVKMLAGGPLFEQAPQYAQDIGADAIAGRGVDAPELARKMLVIS